MSAFLKSVKSGKDRIVSQVDNQLNWRAQWSNSMDRCKTTTVGYDVRCALPLCSSSPRSMCIFHPVYEFEIFNILPFIYPVDKTWKISKCIFGKSAVSTMPNSHSIEMHTNQTSSLIPLFLNIKLKERAWIRNKQRLIRQELISSCISITTIAMKSQVGYGTTRFY